ncbi:tripartite tricarboxylate transporter substrate binding protein [Noviherbaspirillum sp. 1P10PC]|uniref:Bug family tripartite tricarboxylate transporter substrate binding protein n=1 Tax=Noviherbaspirillum sp. 1P10PC TaxID=3132292 RepID=UPI0039A25A8C
MACNALRRKSVTALAAALCAPALLLASPGATAQEYPSKPVKLVVAFTAGGTTDILARAIGQALSDQFKQSFIVENKPGAGGNIGTEYVVRSPADGYTVLVNSVGPISINQTLYKGLKYDPLQDLHPVVQIADVPNVLVVPASLPVNSFTEFMRYARANPGKVSYSSTGVGTSSHLSGFMLFKNAGIDALHVPYKGADALNDLLAGRNQAMFATIPSVISHIKAGKLKAMAVSSLTRSRSLQDVPTVAESGFPGFSAGSWFGLFVPKGTPRAVIDKLNQGVNKALPGLQEQMVREGADPVGGTPEQFAAFTRKEYEKWKVVVQESGATQE